VACLKARWDVAEALRAAGATLHPVELDAGRTRQLRSLTRLIRQLDPVGVHTPTSTMPRSRPATLIADKAYSHPSIWKALRRHRIRTVFPERSDQAEHRAARGSRGGRPPAFDPETYQGRNVVERAFGRLKQRHRHPLRQARP
jgi:transposase